MGGSEDYMELRWWGNEILGEILGDIWGIFEV